MALWLALEAARALWRNLLRSVLTSLGIAVGVAAVVLVVAVGKAGSDSALAALADLGDNLVWIEAGGRNINGVRTGAHGTTSLTVQDAVAVTALMRERHHIEPGREDDFNIRRPDEILKARVQASDTLALLLAGRRRHRHHERDPRFGS